MEHQTKSASIARAKKDPAFIAIVLFITLIGLAIRLTPALQTQFPLNDGGLFYAMIVDLQESNYTLPVYADYNHAQIPFAYPPLAFYIAGLLADLFHIAVLDLVRILPALISTLTIPVFYLVARELSDSPLQIVFGTFAFALLPRTFAWGIMGGGITRSFGMLFAMLMMLYAYHFYSGYGTRHLLGCLLIGALTVLTHPEATVHTAVTCLVFYLWKDRTWKGLLLSLGIAAGILLLTAPWWGLIASRHGVDPFVAAVTASRQDSLNPLIGLFLFFRFLFTDEPFLPILAMLGLLSLFASLAHKRTLIPAWMFILHLIEPRGGTLYMMIPLALLTGYGVVNVILPALGLEVRDTPQQGIMQSLKQILHEKVSRYFIIFLFAYGAMSAYSTSLKIKDAFSLNAMDLEAFAWVRENTPQDEQFLLVTGQLPLRDAWSEWFPVFTERHSQATVFGYEWVNDGQFGKRVEKYRDLQACAHEDTACLEGWILDTGGTLSYVYLRNQEGATRYPLSVSLQQRTDDYELVFQNDQTMIFRRLR